jgi:threonyl-tRNA synthetase
VPVMFVVGRREAEERTVSIRRLGSQKQETAGLEAAIAALTDEEAVPPDLRGTAGQASDAKVAA